ncbi:MAG: hypothetical protein ABI162_00590 [Luteolibacter sp.]
MSKNNNTNSDNQADTTPKRLQRQAKTSGERTDEAGYQKLPPGFRPFAGCAKGHPPPAIRQR